MTAGEFRIVGRPPSADAAVAAVRAAVGARRRRAASPDSRSPTSQALAPGTSLGAFCAALRDAGLDAIAELPVDLARRRRRGGRIGARRGLAVLAADRARAVAARIGSPWSRARATSRARLGGFRVFAPLPRTMSISAPTTGYDDVKQIALARLLAGTSPSIQVDWPLYGPKLAQVALTIGADDVDGVAASDPGVLGTRRSPVEEIRGNIRAAGAGAGRARRPVRALRPRWSSTPMKVVRLGASTI